MERRAVGGLSTPPLPTKIKYTRIRMYVCFPSRQPVLKSALPSAHPGRRESPRVRFPCASREGTGEVGEQRSESEGLEGSGEGGGQNKAQIRKKSTDGCKRLGTNQRELRGPETGVASFSQDDGKILKNLLPLTLARVTFF